MAITISPITKDQLVDLRNLAMQTFTETFKHDNSPQQLEAYYETTYSEESLSKELANPESFYYFVKVDGKPVGFLMTNVGQAQTEHLLEDAYEIQRIYVLQDYQGMGLGKRLFEFALQEAKKLGKTWVWLGVWEKNFKAQKFYAKYGFEKFDEHAFPVSEDKVDLDWLLKKKL